jgi:hypothetical protein
VHWNVTAHPTAEPSGPFSSFARLFRVINCNDFSFYDRDSIHSSAVDGAVAAMGLTVLKTPVRCRKRTRFARG